MDNISWKIVGKRVSATGADSRLANLGTLDCLFQSSVTVSARRRISCKNSIQRVEQVLPQEGSPGQLKTFGD